MNIGQRFKQVFNQGQTSEQPQPQVDISELSAQYQNLKTRTEEALENKHFLLYHNELAIRLDGLISWIAELERFNEEGYDIPRAKSNAEKNIFDLDYFLRILETIEDQEPDDRYFQGLGDIVLVNELYPTGEKFDRGTYYDQEDVAKQFKREFLDVFAAKANGMARSWSVPEMGEIDNPNITIGMYNQALAKSADMSTEFYAKKNQLEETKDSLFVWMEGQDWMPPEISEEQVRGYAMTLDGGKPVAEALAESLQHLKAKQEAEMEPTIQARQARITNDMEEMQTISNAMEQMLQDNQTLFQYAEEPEEV